MNGKNSVKKNDIDMKDLKKKLKVVEGKSKTPTVPSYEVLYEEFKNGIKFKPALLQGGFNKAFDKDINRILSLLDKHKDALDEIKKTIDTHKITYKSFPLLFFIVISLVVCTMVQTKRLLVDHHTFDRKRDCNLQII
jgi:hypothetical protein